MNVLRASAEDARVSEESYNTITEILKHMIRECAGFLGKYFEFDRFGLRACHYVEYEEPLKYECHFYHTNDNYFEEVERLLSYAKKLRRKTEKVMISEGLPEEFLELAKEKVGCLSGAIASMERDLLRRAEFLKDDTSRIVDYVQSFQTVDEIFAAFNRLGYEGQRAVYRWLCRQKAPRENLKEFKKLIDKKLRESVPSGMCFPLYLLLWVPMGDFPDIVNKLPQDEAVTCVRSCLDPQNEKWMRYKIGTRGNESEIRSECQEFVWLLFRDLNQVNMREVFPGIVSQKLLQKYQAKNAFFLLNQEGMGQCFPDVLTRFGYPRPHTIRWAQDTYDYMNTSNREKSIASVSSRWLEHLKPDSE
ncbi:MAG: hypothetical protein K2L24_00360 [Opitutales bacterium]|nr:hypothetical protein [Opitutales bacterium]